nr:uncharacterized mitochondrial protein AtMg00810-like [Tanacetum cinerariifolium]
MCLAMVFPVIESTAFVSKNDGKEKCSICGFKWHPPDKCWEKVRYPIWHHKYKAQGKQNQSMSKEFEKGREICSLMQLLVIILMMKLSLWQCGLYHLLNVLMDQVDARLRNKVENTVQSSLFSCSADLINRIPSYVLQNKTPYEMLLKKFLEYSNLRVFRCFAVAVNPSRIADKFAPRGVLCVFLGYPAHQKGYKLYNLLTRSSFVSRDVVFHEHIFPFDESSSQKFFQPMLMSMPNHTHLAVYDDCEPKPMLYHENQELPIGYVGQGKNVQDTKILSSKLCKLKKSLYVLKQAPKQWFAKLSSALMSFGYKQSKANYSLFTKKNAEGFIVVLVYIDDLMITGNDTEQVKTLKKQLSSQFHLKDLGDLHYFLGLEVTKAEAGMFVSQKKYNMEMLQEADVMHSKPYKLPMDPNLKL